MIKISTNFAKEIAFGLKFKKIWGIWKIMQSMFHVFWWNLKEVWESLNWCNRIIVKIVCDILIGNSQNLINDLIGFVNEIFVYFFNIYWKNFGSTSLKLWFMSFWENSSQIFVMWLKLSEFLRKDGIPFKCKNIEQTSAKAERIWESILQGNQLASISNIIL